MRDQRLADKLWEQDQRREAAPPSASNRGYDFRPDDTRGETSIWTVVFCIIVIPSVLICAWVML